MTLLTKFLKLYDLPAPACFCVVTPSENLFISRHQFSMRAEGQITRILESDFFVDLVTYYFDYLDGFTQAHSIAENNALALLPHEIEPGAPDGLVFK